MNTHDCSYSLLRYCQDREAGEFANIGVLFWCPQDRFLGFRGSHRFARLTHFFGDLDRDGYRLLVAHVERRFDQMAEDVVHGLPLDPLRASARELATLATLAADAGGVATRRAIAEPLVVGRVAGGPGCIAARIMAGRDSETVRLGVTPSWRQGGRTAGCRRSLGTGNGLKPELRTRIQKPLRPPPLGPSAVESRVPWGYAFAGAATGTACCEAAKRTPSYEPDTLMWRSTRGRTLRLT